METIQKAGYEDCERLTFLAQRSKAHWGYSQAFMEACQQDLTVTPDDIDQAIVRIAWDNESCIGFYCLNLQGPLLEALFVDPFFIGKGVGKVLWKHLIGQAMAHNIAYFDIESDPEAEGFYQLMGAKRIGQVASSVFEDRQLPLLRMIVE